MRRMGVCGFGEDGRMSDAGSKGYQAGDRNLALELVRVVEAAELAA